MDHYLKNLDTIFQNNLRQVISQKEKSTTRYQEDIENGTFEGNFAKWATWNDPMLYNMIQQLRASSNQYQQALLGIKGPKGKEEQVKVRKLVEESIGDVA